MATSFRKLRPGARWPVRSCSPAFSSLLCGPTIWRRDFAEETRRRDFLRPWDLVAKVPFFHDIGSSTIADVAGLLRPRDYQAGAVIMRRGERYFVASGVVQIRLTPEPIY